MVCNATIVVSSPILAHFQARAQSLHIAKKLYGRSDLASRIEVMRASHTTQSVVNFLCEGHSDDLLVS